MEALKTLVGGGKTFTGAMLLIGAGVAKWAGVLPEGLDITITPTEAISAGLMALGLGAKLQRLIGLFIDMPADEA